MGPRGSSLLFFLLPPNQLLFLFSVFSDLLGEGGLEVDPTLEPGRTKVGVEGLLPPEPPITDPVDVFGLEPSLEEGLEKFWLKVGGGNTGGAASLPFANCCWRSCRVGCEGSRNGPEGTRGGFGWTFWSLPGPGERARAFSGGDGSLVKAGDELFRGMAGRSERSEFMEKSEDNLFAAMMKGFK
jgi:hypothetical protein